MTGTTAHQPSRDGGTELPRPRPGARWRWSRPRRALVAGGALAAVLGLGLGVGASAGAGAATTKGSTSSRGAAHGRPPGGMDRPTVSGKITALSGDDITVQTTGTTKVTVTYSSSTKFETNPGPNGGTTSSASALKVGDFIGVQGSKSSDGAVTASTVVIGRPAQGEGGPGRAAGRGTRPTGAPNS